METNASKVMAPMLRANINGPVKLRYAEQAYIASWAAKTAYVLQQLHPADDLIPTSDYRDFHRKQQPSSNVFVTIGARHIAGSSKGANVFEYKARFIGEKSRGIHHAHFVVGAIYFGIATFVGRERRYPTGLNDEVDRGVKVIWPLTREVLWPCPSISDVGGLDGMFNTVTTAFWGL